MITSGRVYSAIFLLILSSLNSLAIADAKDLDRFGKCYLQFVGETVLPNNPLLMQVKNGTKTGEQACAEILSQGNLVNGELTSNGYEEGKKILHTFNLVHNSFFSSSPFNPTGHNIYLYDTNDRSYYLIQALFSKNSDGSSNYKFNKIFTDPTTYIAQRDGSNESNNGLLISRIDTSGSGYNDYTMPFTMCGGNWPDPKYCTERPFKYQTINQAIFDAAKIDYSTGVLVDNGSSSTFLRDSKRLFNISRDSIDGSTANAYLDDHELNYDFSDHVQTGEIVGLKSAAAFGIPHVLQRLFNDSDGYYRNYLGPAFKQPYPNPTEDIYDNLGAGILFTPSYQQVLGMDDENIGMQNGLDKVPRKWTQDILNDFFCREIPVIRQADAVDFTISTFNTSAPFRNSVSCMRCHATIDNLSTIARNYQFINSTAFGNGSMQINHHHQPTFAALDSWPDVADPYFPVRPGDGRFLYRDYAGALHNIQLTASSDDITKSYRDFGKVVSLMDDPYICLTSKYFKYLTGIEMKFYDAGDVDTPALTARDQKIKDYVTDLGKKLKASGDLNATILDIVSSDLYLDPESLNQ